MGNYNSPAVMLAIEMYRRSEASIEKASNMAGISMEIFKENGVEVNLGAGGLPKRTESLKESLVMRFDCHTWRNSRG